jgi:Bacterial Ig domain
MDTSGGQSTLLACPESHENASPLSVWRMPPLGAMLIFVAMAVATAWYVHDFASNILFYDQWSDVNVLRSAHDGTLTLGTLWAQHNENRILFPNLVVLLLGYTTHLNVVIEDFLSGALWCAATILLILAHKRRSPSIPWLLYCPVALLLISFIGLADALFGFNLSWYLVLAGLAGALFLLDRPVLTKLTFFVAVALAVVGSYSSLQGLLIWPAGLVLLFLRRRSNARLLQWIAYACVTGVVYFIHFNFAAGGTNDTYLFGHPLATTKFFFSVIGNVVDAAVPNTPLAGNASDLELGIVIFAIAVWALIRGFRRGSSSGAPIGVSLIVFGLLFVATVSIGRTQLGLSTAGRYSTFALTIWAGAYLVFLEPLPRELRELGAYWLGRGDRVAAGGWSRDAPWAQVVTVAAQLVLVVLIVFQLVLGTENGLIFARAWRSQEAVIADVSVNVKKAPDPMVQSQLGQLDPSFIRQMAGYARSQRLSLFGTSVVAADTRQGLFPSLLTGVIVPADGSTVSGNTALDAVVSDSTNVKRVEFQATGPSLHGAIIGIATPKPYGWVASWDTTKVANGVYLVRSVLVRSGATRIFGSPVGIRVENNSKAS